MKTKLSFLVTALLFAYQVKAQNTITVDNSVGANAQYSDLQSAISAASNGDIIYVHPSEINYGIITIDKSLTLVGFGHSDPDSKTFVNDIILAENSSNTKISGFYVTDDIYINSSNMLSNIIIENNLIVSYLGFDNGGVNNVIIRGNVINQIGNTSSSSTQNNYTNAIISNNMISNYVGLKNHQSITIKNNIFYTPSSSYPIYNADSGAGTITAQNNIIYYNVTSTYNPDADGVLYENCLTYNFGSGSVAPLIGSNNLDNQNPLFVSYDGVTNYSTVNDYNLQAGSPAIGTGVGGIEPGATLSVTINTNAN